MSIWKKLIWFAIGLFGAAAMGVMALSRGEQVNALWIVAAGLCTFAISYRFYSKWLATKVLLLNDERATPAFVQNDGKDFVPTNRWMVFGLNGGRRDLPVGFVVEEVAPRAVCETDQ